MRTALASAAFVMMGAAAATPVSAQAPAAGPACGDMQLFESAESVTFVDTGAEGVDPGDRRVIHSLVSNAAGDHVADFYVITTVMTSTDGADVAMATGHIKFTNGDIMLSSIVVLPNAADTEASTRDPIHWSINGGTGAFAGAIGTVINAPPSPEATLEHWSVDIYVTCP